MGDVVALRVRAGRKQAFLRNGGNPARLLREPAMPYFASAMAASLPRSSNKPVFGHYSGGTLSCRRWCASVSG
ncbi:hypothetical protein Ahu01nite_080840 [Winogradskya humida]|uniref:Uncharacterized protein n=1 Tax=Winogradskya humida TaxID=113566 RepID=A0ABQ4A3Q2_9ACTN|nr:hypothetical protein Ahu01nite_080840 [Actinoplanes humidus]